MPDGRIETEGDAEWLHLGEVQSTWDNLVVLEQRLCQPDGSRSSDLVRLLRESVAVGIDVLGAATKGRSS